MFDKKEYNRARQKKIYGGYQQRRVTLFKTLGDKCFICESKAYKGFNLHHDSYDPEESNYPTHARTMHVRLKRLAEAEKNPERFRLLDPTCHTLVESIRREQGSHLTTEECKVILIKSDKIRICPF